MLKWLIKNNTIPYGSIRSLIYGTCIVSILDALPSDEIRHVQMMGGAVRAMY